MQKENGERREGSKFYCFRASLTMNLSSRYVDLEGELCFPNAVKFA